MKLAGKTRRRRKPNGIAATLRLFKPKIVGPRKGKKAYSRKKLGKPRLETD